MINFKIQIVENSMPQNGHLKIILQMALFQYQVKYKLFPKLYN